MWPECNVSFPSSVRLRSLLPRISQSMWESSSSSFGILWMDESVLLLCDTIKNVASASLIRSGILNIHCLLPFLTPTVARGQTDSRCLRFLFVLCIYLWSFVTNNQFFYYGGHSCRFEICGIGDESSRILGVSRGAPLRGPVSYRDQWEVSTTNFWLWLRFYYIKNTKFCWQSRL